MTEAYDKVQLLRGTLSAWTRINPILDEGEAAVVYDTETGVPIGMKAGNGKLHFSDLPFMGAGSFTTYTKEEIDAFFTESNKRINVLQVSVETLYKLVPSSATPENRLLTKEDLTNLDVALKELIKEQTQNKLDKNSEVTTLDKAYIKRADGTQDLVDLTNSADASSNGIAVRQSGRIKTRRAAEADDAINKEDLQEVETEIQRVKTQKLDKITVQDNNEYVYKQDKDSSKLLQVSDEAIPGTAVKRTSTGTLKSSKATKEGEAVIYEQLQDVLNNLDAHKKNAENPHKVTKAQVGLNNVDNTADINKPVSNATQAALSKKQDTLPGDVNSSKYVLQPSLSDGGALVKKPISDLASATDLAQEKILREQADEKKVDKAEGYSLSQNDFTNTLKETYDNTVEKVSGIEPKAQVNVLEKIVLFGKEVPIAGKRVILTGMARAEDLSNEELARTRADEALTKSVNDNTAAIADESTIRKDNDDLLSNKIDRINDVIPTQASKINLLADRDFVNSSIATNTATFWGTFSSLEDLTSEVIRPGKNDYANVRTQRDGSYIFTRYKYSGETVTEHTAYDPSEWKYDYTVNSSGFTAEQWAAINSGITETLRNQIGLNTSAIEEAKTNIELLETSKVDNQTYTAGLINLKTTLEEEIATKQRKDSLQILDWFNDAENAWAKDGTTNVYLSTIRDKVYGALETDFYHKYLSKLRTLTPGTRVPYDANSWANILAHEDSSEDVWIFSQKEGLFYIITVNDTSRKIEFTEKPLYSLATLNDLSKVRLQMTEELGQYVQKSTETEEKIGYKIAVYDADGKLLPSNHALSSIQSVDLTTERWKAIRYLKGYANLQADYNAGGKICLDKELQIPQDPNNPREIYSGVAYIDADGVSNGVALVTSSASFLTDIVLPSSIDISLCRPSNSAEEEITLENSSLSLVLFSTGVSDNADSYILSAINEASFINCYVTLNNPANRQDGTSGKAYKLSNSKMSINAADLASTEALTFTKVEHSRIDIDDTSGTNDRYIFKDVISSTVYLHHTAKIRVDASTGPIVHHHQELEVVLCADYELSPNDAISGTGSVRKITNLSKATTYTSAVFFATVTANGSTRPATIPASIVDLKWSESANSSGEYSHSIEFAEHGCGYTKLSQNTPMYVPKVKTYFTTDTANPLSSMVEVYDSAEINLLTGTVTIYSKFNTGVYLVVIS